MEPPKEGSDTDSNRSTPEVPTAITPSGVSTKINYDKELTLGKRLGSGNYGIVYEGTYRNQPVAIKVLHRLDPSAVKEFEREGDVLAQLKHPRIVKLYGVCSERPNFALVMELLPSGSLTDLLRSDVAISWQKRLQIAVDVAMALCYLHMNNIVHCDVKSLNVLIEDTDHGPRAKLTDFGMARIKRDNSVYPTGQPGSWGWTAPELVLEEGTARNTKEVDVYAFGVVLWELGSRRAPFEGLSCLTILDRIKQNRRDPISDDTPKTLAQLISRCCSTAPSDRPSMAMVVDVLAAHLWPYRINCLKIKPEVWAEGEQWQHRATQWLAVAGSNYLVEYIPQPSIDCDAYDCPMPIQCDLQEFLHACDYIVSPKIAIAIALDIAWALNFLHSNNIACSGLGAADIHLELYRPCNWRAKLAGLTYCYTVGTELKSPSKQANLMQYLEILFHLVIGTKPVGRKEPIVQKIKEAHDLSTNLCRILLNFVGKKPNKVTLEDIIECLLLEANKWDRM